MYFTGGTKASSRLIRLGDEKMNYEKPEMELVLFNGIDVITSSTMVDTGVGGGGGNTDDDGLDFNGGFN